jgi:hypothetical protein
MIGMIRRDPDRHLASPGRCLAEAGRCPASPGRCLAEAGRHLARPGRRLVGSVRHLECPGPVPRTADDRAQCHRHDPDASVCRRSCAHRGRLNDPASRFDRSSQYDLLRHGVRRYGGLKLYRDHHGPREQGVRLWPNRLKIHDQAGTPRLTGYRRRPAPTRGSPRPMRCSWAAGYPNRLTGCPSPDDWYQPVGRQFDSCRLLRSGQSIDSFHRHLLRSGQPFLAARRHQPEHRHQIDRPCLIDLRRRHSNGLSRSTDPYRQRSNELCRCRSTDPCRRYRRDAGYRPGRIPPESDRTRWSVVLRAQPFIHPVIREPHRRHISGRYAKQPRSSGM